LALKRKGRRERDGGLAETRRGGDDDEVVDTILENGEFLEEEGM
jgi:hypothetical protein